MDDKTLMQRAVDLARQSVDQGGEPFGAVLVLNGKVLAEAMNQAHIDHDPTAHAEIQALRIASRENARGAHPGSVMYASGKPCPMCMAAMVNAGVALGSIDLKKPEQSADAGTNAQARRVEVVITG